MTSDAPNDAGELELLVSVGEAMTIAGDSIEGVRQRLLAVAAARGVDDVRVVAFPASLWVQTGSGDSTHAQCASFANRNVRLDQIAALYELIDRIEATPMPADDATRATKAILYEPARFGTVVRAFGHHALRFSP